MVLKLLLALLLFSFLSQGSRRYEGSQLRYQTFKGSCPQKISGHLSLELVKIFEQNRSLAELKQYILQEKIPEQYFLSQYQIEYDPLREHLKLTFDCPKPLMRAYIYKQGGKEHYLAVLTDDGKFVDPHYETLTQGEGQESYELPGLSISVEEIEGRMTKVLTEIIKKMDQKIYSQLSEVVVNEQNEVIMVFSVHQASSSVFLGKENLSEKVLKAEKILGFMKKRGRVASIINLTNLDRPVVKFSP